MRIKLFLSSCILSFGMMSYAQDDTSISIHQNKNIQTNNFNTLNQFTISGYFQAQYQFGEEMAILKVGYPNTNLNHSFNRIGIRRGRVKLEFQHGIANSVFQVDITEKGIAVKDVYLHIKTSWLGSSSFKVGIFNRPYGYEVSYSSAKRESPERATVITTLFPEERDLGIMLTLQAPPTSKWNFLKLETALLSGNGIKLDMDNRKDLTVHLSANKNFQNKDKVSGGISYYSGSVFQGSSNVYKMSNDFFSLNHDTLNIGKYTKRKYFGTDAQFLVNSILGVSQLYGEYIIGVQPGTKENSLSPNYNTKPNYDTYIRNFRGAYITFVQDLKKNPFSIIIKYDFYDPNINISKNEIGTNGSSKGDIAFYSIGSGILWKINNNFRMTGYYDWIRNETSINLKGFEKDIHDNIFTFRIQYKF